MSQSSDEHFGRVEQSFGGGASFLGVGQNVNSSRSIRSGEWHYGKRLSEADWEGPVASPVIGLKSRMPGVSPEVTAPRDDMYLGLGAKALIGLELQFNLSEAGRRLFGGEGC